MKVKHAIIGSSIGLLSLIGISSSTYVVSETEQAVITKFGKPKEIVLGSLQSGGVVDSTLVNRVVDWNEAQENKVRISSSPGIHFKQPFVESVKKFDDRILHYDAAPTEVVTRDKKHILIDNYAKWRITNPLVFMRTVGSVNSAQSRLDDIIYSVIRDYAGQNNFIELIRSNNELEYTQEKESFENIERGRESIMKYITKISNEAAQEYGIDVLDVRIKRADLPPANAKSVYDRMIAERQRISNEYRSRGRERATEIRAQTDREVTDIRTTAYMEAESIRGEGDAEALRIYADAFDKSPEFYNFWRTLESYENAFGSTTNRTKIIMPMDTEFNKYLKGPRAK